MSDDLSKQLKVSATILAAIAYDEPKGFQRVMRARLVGTEYRMGVVTGRPEGKAQEFIDRLRETLMDKATIIPDLQGIRSPEMSDTAQRRELRNLLDLMVKPPEEKTSPNQINIPFIDLRGKINPKLVQGKDALSKPELKQALVEFMAAEEVAACHENSANISCNNNKASKITVTPRDFSRL